MSERNPHEKDGFVTSSITRYLYLKTCVAVKIGDTVDVRDTKDPKSPTLSFTRAEWDAFIQGVKKGEFDLPQKANVGSRTMPRHKCIKHFVAGAFY